MNLNRTSVGLKPSLANDPFSHRRYLNRTSVGLKLIIITSAVFSNFRPQSNQRGIETKSLRALRALTSIEPAWD